MFWRDTAGVSQEWHSEALPRHVRMTKQIQAVIADARYVNFHQLRGTTVKTGAGVSLTMAWHYFGRMHHSAELSHLRQCGRR